MAKLIYASIMSLDGYINDETGNFDWAAPDEAVHAFVNDLERPVFEKYVFLARLKSWLRQQPEVAVALMSGSGSTLFAVLRDAAKSDELAHRAREKIDPTLWTCATQLSSSTSPRRIRD